MESVNGNIRGGRGLGSIEVLGCFQLNTRWARVFSYVDVGLEELEEVIDCDK